MDSLLKLVENFDKFNPYIVDVIINIIDQYTPNDLDKDLPKSLKLIKDFVRSDDDSNMVIPINEALESSLIADLDLALQNPSTRKKAIEVIQRVYKLVAALQSKSKDDVILNEIANNN